jgi:hypothetical protein
MRLASWAILGSLLINTAFGLVVAGAVTRPVGAALAQCPRHAAAAPAATRQPVSGHYLAAVRMGWEVG